MSEGEWFNLAQTVRVEMAKRLLTNILKILQLELPSLNLLIKALPENFDLRIDSLEQYSFLARPSSPWG